MVLWIVNVCNLICGFLMLVWVPAILHGEGLSPTDAIFAATMYAFGSIFGVAIIAPIADRFGAERVVAGIVGVGAISMVIAGSMALPYVALCATIGGVGVGIGGGQHGINSGALYPASIRATGAGWALGIGRNPANFGSIGGRIAARPRLVAACNLSGCVRAGILREHLAWACSHTFADIRIVSLQQSVTVSARCFLKKWSELFPTPDWVSAGAAAALGMNRVSPPRGAIDTRIRCPGQSCAPGGPIRPPAPQSGKLAARAHIMLAAGGSYLALTAARCLGATAAKRSRGPPFEPGYRASGSHQYLPSGRLA